MRLPTDQEIAEAGRALDRDGPLPLGVIVDRNRELSALLQGMQRHNNHAASDGERDTLLKAALLLGLNYGIRIGELRARARHIDS